jgi:precorrin-6y C5,15-methyltransferase (decarboxylating) CbiE subunit
MENSVEKLMIVGCGPGAPEYLTHAGRHAIDGASVLAGAPDLLGRFAAPHHGRICFGSDGGLNLEGMLAAIEACRQTERIAVLVSGDPGISSLARPVLRRFGNAACRVIPGVSSVQLAFARLGLDWTDARIVSAHKGIPDLSAGDIAPFRVVAILGGHRRAQAWIADLAEDSGDGRALVMCEDLSLPGEKINRISIDEFRRTSISTRTVVLLIKEEYPG